MLLSAQRKVVYSKEGSLVKLGRRVALSIATLVLVALTAGPVLAADPVLPTGETGDLSLKSLKMALAYGTIVASFTVEKFSLDRILEITDR